MTARTRKLAFSLFLLLVSLGCHALARESYFGVGSDDAFVIQGEKVVPQVGMVSPGVQLGVKSLLGPFEHRTTTEHSVYKSVGLSEGALNRELSIWAV